MLHGSVTTNVLPKSMRRERLFSSIFITAEKKDFSIVNLSVLICRYSWRTRSKTSKGEQ